MKLHLLLYANGVKYQNIQDLIIRTFGSVCSIPYQIHSYNKIDIQNKIWFDKIKHLNDYNIVYKRDYFNIWKAFLTLDLYNSIPENDIIYYVDCSIYYDKTGFVEDPVNLVNVCNKIGFIAGAIGYDIPNFCRKVSSDINLLKIIDENIDENYLNYNHILNSWYMVKKDSSKNYIDFFNDWVYYSLYKNDIYKNELITYHNTVDQCIFNALVYKYNYKIFYNNFPHDCIKKNNIILKIINNYFEINSIDTFIEKFIIDYKLCTCDIKFITIYNENNNFTIYMPSYYLDLIKRNNNILYISMSESDHINNYNITPDKIYYIKIICNDKNNDLYLYIISLYKINDKYYLLDDYQLLCKLLIKHNNITDHKLYHDMLNLIINNKYFHLDTYIILLNNLTYYFSISKELYDFKDIINYYENIVK